MFDLLNFLNVMDLSGRQTLSFPAGSRLGSRARAADLELAMEKRDTVLEALPLEDADGYMQCYFDDVEDDDVARARESILGALALRRSCVVVTQSVGMGSKKRAKSLERLSTISVTPSSAVEATTSSPSDWGRVRSPRIPPRPNEHVLSRFLQQRAKITTLRSSSGAASSGGGQGRPARRKYVEVDVIPPKENCAGGGGGGGRNVTPQPKARLSRAPPRTNYVLLQTENMSDSTSSHTHHTRGPQGRSKVPVQRSKSSACDCDSQCSAHLESEAPLPRKPRKISASVYSSSTLPPRAISLYDERLLATTGQVGLADSELETRFDAHSISDTGSWNITDSRAGTTAPQNSTTLPRSHPQAVSGGVFIQEPHTPVPPLKFRIPPPPNRKPPTRPPGPTPRPRKPRTMNSQDAPGLDAPTQGTSQNPQRFGEPLDPPPVSTAPPSSSGSKTSVSPSPHARGPWKEEIVTTGVQVDPDDPEDGAYSYVDLVKNRHIIARQPTPSHHRQHSGKPEWFTVFTASSNITVCVLCGTLPYTQTECLILSCAYLWHCVTNTRFPHDKPIRVLSPSPDARLCASRVCSI